MLWPITTGSKRYAISIFDGLISFQAVVVVVGFCCNELCACASWGLVNTARGHIRRYRRPICHGGMNTVVLDGGSKISKNDIVRVY